MDVPSTAGPEQRIYLEGDERTYNRGAVLREMRDPLLNVIAASLLCQLCHWSCTLLRIRHRVHKQHGRELENKCRGRCCAEKYLHVAIHLMPVLK